MDKPTLDSSVSELCLSVRSENCLYHAKITTIRQLVSMTAENLLELKNFGQQSLRDIKRNLSDNGFQLGVVNDPIQTPAKEEPVIKIPIVKEPTPAPVQESKVEVPAQELAHETPCPECAKLKEKIALMEKWRIGKDELDKLNEKIVALEYRIDELEENAEKED